MRQTPKPKQKIIYTEWAVANVFKDGVIELHKDLKLHKYRKLKKKILYHEMSHNFEKGFLYNFGIDFFDFVAADGLLQFMFKRPKTWIQMLPIYWIKSRGLIYDKNLILFYSIIAASILIIIKLFGG